MERKHQLIAHVFLNAADYTDSTRGEILSNDLKYILNMAFDAMTPRQKEVFRMSREGHLSYKGKSSSNNIFYPSVGMGFILSEAIQMPEWLPYLKLRGSWAESGGDIGARKLGLTYGFNEKFRDNPIGSILPSITLKSDTSSSVVRSAASVERNDLLRRGQFWLTSRVQQKYPETIFTFSVWNPPAWMKEGGYSTPLYPASHDSLMKKHYQSFADYLVSFCKEFQTIGVNTYAISPSNEPGFAAPWNSCVWTSDEMGEFIHDYLLHTFSKNELDTKVQFGENPAWSTVFDKLKKISSADFVNSVLTAYPDMDPQRMIAVGHGYVLPDTIPLPAELRRTPIVSFVEAQKNIPMWVKEISDITPLDVSMKDGLYWADMFQKYLMGAHVSAIVWWLGAQPTTTNESLIVLNNESGEYVLSKRYDAFGNYTRYIPAGSRCVANFTEGLPEGVCVSSFCKDK